MVTGDATAELAQAAVRHPFQRNVVHRAAPSNELRSEREHGQRCSVEPLLERLIGAAAQLDPFSVSVGRACGVPRFALPRYALHDLSTVDEHVRAPLHLARLQRCQLARSLARFAYTFSAMAAVNHHP